MSIFMEEAMELRKNYIRYISLNILSMIALSFYILADTYFISKDMGAIGLAALNFAIPIFTSLTALAMMIGIGGGTYYALEKKKGIERGNEIFTATLIMGGLVSLVYLTIPIFFTERLALLLGARGEVLSLAIVYLRTILSFSPFFVLNNILLAFIRNDGNPRLPMIAMIVSSFSNVVLDYVFMFPLGWRMFGAAFASGLAPIIGIIIQGTYFLWKKNKFHLKRIYSIASVYKKIISLGLNSFITEMASAISIVVFNFVILNLVGNIGVGAYGVIANIAFNATAIFVGVSQGQQPLASFHFGMGERLKVKKILKYNLVTALGISVGLVALILLFHEPIIGIFNSEGNKELAQIAEEGIQLYFLGYLFAGVNIIGISFLSAISMEKVGLVLSLFRSIIILIPMVFLLSILWDLKGVWLGFVLTEALVFLWTVRRLYISYNSL